MKDLFTCRVLILTLLSTIPMTYEYYMKHKKMEYTNEAPLRRKSNKKNQVNAHKHYVYVHFQQKKPRQQQSTPTVSAIVRSDRIQFDGDRQRSAIKWLINRFKLKLNPSND